MSKRKLPPLYGYHRCLECCFGRHESCDGYAHIHHVGGSVEIVACVCFEVEHRA